MNNEHPYVRMHNEAVIEHVHALFLLSALFGPALAWLILGIPLGKIFPETDFGMHPVMKMHLELTVLVAGSLSVSMIVGHFIWNLILDENGVDDPRPWGLIKVVMLPVLITAAVTLMVCWLKTKAIIPEIDAFVMQHYHWLCLAVVLPLVVRFFIRNWRHQ